MSGRLTEAGKAYVDKMNACWADSVRGMLRSVCVEVVTDPDIAGTTVDIGDWEKGDIGAHTLVYPSLEEAQQWLEDNPE